MKSKLLCPHCGHHIADIAVPSPAPGPGHYRDVDLSPVEAFIEARCCVEPRQRIETKVFRAAYIKWCEEEGQSRLSPQTMGRIVAALPYIHSAASNGKRYYTGITLA